LPQKQTSWAPGSVSEQIGASKLPGPYFDKFQILTLYPILLTKHLKHILSVPWVFYKVPLKDIFNMLLFGQVRSEFTERTILRVQLLNLLRKWALHLNKKLNYFRHRALKLIVGDEYTFSRKFHEVFSSVLLN
jgi:hypothetical protein